METSKKPISSVDFENQNARPNTANRDERGMSRIALAP